jgi:hypothetical protein
MFKNILLSVALATRARKALLASLIGVASLSAVADPTVAQNAAEASSIAAQKCQSGCLILSPEDIAILEAQVNAFAARAFQEGAVRGYEKGVEDLAEAAKKNPKICPKQA